MCGAPVFSLKEASVEGRVQMSFINGNASNAGIVPLDREETA
jgi:hypothetical protein